MKIHITYDIADVYNDRTIEVKELVNDYIDVLNEVEDAETINFLCNADEDTALAFIQTMWGIEYQKVNC
jgi:hypothetical protein